MCRWLTSVILATQELEIRGSWFKTMTRAYLKNIQYKKELMEWLKW
jgi:hypothetical protein